ncbi:hypothetical protein [Oscillatoria acuminata]|uniref:Uncharacterized protein n=1 Tax=Oscillatoria acuminata PCC 6304 TaxID=56110 RepID=K9TM39_9CYAN|nr:hypothetical protein [Oscillatoria acuminata]AFY83605.1 hypothetical protein Oscil6304_4076 [Oscillatoria acuminata PCC 6304]
MAFEMKICEIFKLQSGQTVFAGPLEGTSISIQNCQAELEVDGVIIQKLMIEGEFIMNVKHPVGHRAIFTTESVKINRSIIKQQTCYLRSVNF